MAEFVEAAAGQTILANRPAILTTSIRCNKGFIIHDDGSGLITLRGVNGRRARYLLLANTNIAVPEGGTAGEIGFGLFIAGELENSAIAKSTPAAVEEFNNVTLVKYIDIPCGCCRDIFVGNATASGGSILTDGTLNVVINRVA